MSTYLDALLSGQTKARSLATSEDAVEVDVAESAPPNPGDVLTAVDSTHATWQPSGGGGGDATGLETTGDPIDVASAAPPVAGQVLTAADSEHAEWRVPGLHYDPSIKFWTSSAGSATILPGTWGFIQQPPEGTAPVVVYIVSSLEAPPVDARFGLYVGRTVTVPVTVQVLGASQIQGLDGLLGTSATLLPGSDYEWVFYHEDESALWGLVSDTAGVAKHLRYSGGTIEIASADPPIGGSVLTAIDADHAEWLVPSGGSAAHAATHARGGSDIVAASRLSESAGPTVLDIGAIATGQYLQRSGATIVGVTPAAGAQIATKLLSSDGTGDNTDLTQLGFSVAAGETVMCEWFLQIDCNGVGGGPGRPILYLQHDLASHSVSRCNIYNQWTIAAAITPAYMLVTFLQNLHTVQGVAPTSGLSTCHLMATLTAGPAIFWRPFLERRDGLSIVKAGSWGRCTRGAVIS